MNTKLEQAARQLLEAIEDFQWYRQDIDTAIADLREALEQPAQSVEPVLVVELEPSYMSRGHFYKGDKPHIDPTKVWKLPIGTKLYTAPRPARQRLTDGELDLILQKSPIKANYADLTALVRAVEKAHGIGGEA